MVNRRAGRVTKARGALLIPLVTVVALSLAAFGAYRIGQLNQFICDGACSPAFVEPPKALDLAVDPVAAAPDSSTAGTADPAKVSSAVQSSLKQSALGDHVGFIALDPESGTVLYTSGSGTFTPASTTKVLTAFAALEAIDAGDRFATTVVQSEAGSIVLVGGGDPFLTSRKPRTALYAHTANLTDLAKKTAEALKKSGTDSVSLGFDDSLFSGPAVSRHWDSSYVSANIVTPVSALWADAGVGSNGLRSPTPAASAAGTFASLLRKNGIDVKAPVSRAKAPADAPVVVRDYSAPVGQILESLIQRSDNEAAEVMLRHVAVAKGKPGTFDDGTAEVRRLLSANEVDIDGLELHDGSGLSRDNRISPLTLAQTIRAAANSPRAASLLSSLPIGGFNGSLHNRFKLSSARDGRGVVHAKTGTLTGVHSLVGFVSDADGRPIAFTVMTDRTGPAAPEAVKAALDNVAASLARCHCGT
ncbi:MAG: D-alanyl-D-alanine carboxypeptidase/D-alanyl-D-alanine endopeptidase [Aeromicrobium sp.]